MTPMPETLRELAYRLEHVSFQGCVAEITLIRAAADAWEADIQERNNWSVRYLNLDLQLAASEQGRAMAEALVMSHEGHIATLEQARQRAEKALRSIRARAERIESGVVKCTSFSAADFDMQVIDAALAQTKEENVAVLYPMGTDILRTRVCPECESVITSGINRCPHCSGE